VTTGFDKPTAQDRFYLPDLCTPAAVLRVVLIAELAAMALTLARQPAWNLFFTDLAKTSLLMLWLVLTSAATLCALRRHLARFSLPTSSLLTAGAVLTVVWLVSEGVYWLGRFYEDLVVPGVWFPGDRGFFITRNLVLGAILIAILLRYFYVTHEWRRNVEEQAASRINALQARIRPHFLFNSMNTIAELTRQDPAAAEAAVEDLSDLFRASLSDAKDMVRLEEEMEITRVYERVISISSSRRTISFASLSEARNRSERSICFIFPFVMHFRYTNCVRSRVIVLQWIIFASVCDWPLGHARACLRPSTPLTTRSAWLFPTVHEPATCADRR
jgi:two-component system sensor histidine kinase AlgZ